jgi:hypothetical protein
LWLRRFFPVSGIQNIFLETNQNILLTPNARCQNKENAFLIQGNLVSARNAQHARRKCMRMNMWESVCARITSGCLHCNIIKKREPSSSLSWARRAFSSCAALWKRGPSVQCWCMWWEPHVCSPDCVAQSGWGLFPRRRAIHTHNDRPLIKFAPRRADKIV